MIDLKNAFKVMFVMSMFMSVFAWGRQTPWERYLAYPSARNAQKIQAITKSNPDEASDDAGEFAILKIQIIAGDRQAFRAAIRLAKKS